MILDEFIIRWLEARYLWLWDRTGVAVGVLMFASMAVSLMLEVAENSWLKVLFFFVFGVISYFRYDDQMSERYEKFNEQSLANRSGSWRLICLGLIVVNSVNHYGELLGHLSNGAFVIYMWLTSMCVRRREPPEKRVLVRQRTAT